MNLGEDRRLESEWCVDLRRTVGCVETRVASEVDIRKWRVESYRRRRREASDGMPHFDAAQRRFVADWTGMGSGVYRGGVIAFRHTRVMGYRSLAVGAICEAQRVRERSSRDHEATRDDQQTPNHYASIARTCPLTPGNLTMLHPRAS